MSVYPLNTVASTNYGIMGRPNGLSKNNRLTEYALTIITCLHLWYRNNKTNIA